MKKIALAAAALLMGSSAFANVCEDQVRAFVEANYGPVTTVHMYYPTEEGGAGETIAWAKTTACTGQVAVRLSASELTCNNAHYGRVPNYVRGSWATGDCR